LRALGRVLHEGTSFATLGRCSRPNASGTRTSSSSTAEELEALNDAIVGEIEIVATLP
jgi:hypothetical protein